MLAGNAPVWRGDAEGHNIDTAAPTRARVPSSAWSRAPIPLADVRTSFTAQTPPVEAAASFIRRADRGRCVAGTSTAPRPVVGLWLWKTLASSCHRREAAGPARSTRRRLVDGPAMSMTERPQRVRTGAPPRTSADPDRHAPPPGPQLDADTVRRPSRRSTRDVDATSTAAARQRGAADYYRLRAVGRNGRYEQGLPLDGRRVRASDEPTPREGTPIVPGSGSIPSPLTALDHLLRPERRQPSGTAGRSPPGDPALALGDPWSWDARSAALDPDSATLSARLIANVNRPNLSLSDWAVATADAKAGDPEYSIPRTQQGGSITLRIRQARGPTARTTATSRSATSSGASRPTSGGLASTRRPAGSRRRAPRSRSR